MATTYTPILRLAVSSALTPEARNNLYKLDGLGRGVFTDAEGVTKLRSPDSIDVLPDDPSVGGDGIGGAINLGSEAQRLDAVTSFSESTRIMGYLDLNDQDENGGSFLRMRYLSTAEGVVEVTSRVLTLDVGASDRTMILNADLRTDISTLGVGPLTFTLPTIDDSLVGASDTATLTNKTIDASLNTLSNIADSAIAASAGIAYSKLNLAESITVNDLSLTFALPYEQLDLSNAIMDSDISPIAEISYSKLDLASSVTDADIAPGAGVSYSKLALTNSIVNADISATAAIAGSKISPVFTAPLAAPSLSVQGAFKTTFSPTTQLADINLTLPSALPPGPGYVMSVSETGVMSYTAAGAGTVSSVDIGFDGATSDILSVAGGPITASGTFVISFDDQPAGTVLAGPVGGGPGMVSFRALEISDLPVGGGTTYTEVWENSDGASLNVTHGLDSTGIVVSLFDVDSGELLFVDTISIVNSNTVTLSASEAPSGSGWSVVVQK